MAEAFPETPFNGSLLETPTSNDVSVDASRWDGPVQQPPTPLSNSSGTAPATLTTTQATLPGSSSKQYHGGFVYHKMERKTTSMIKEKIEEHVRSRTHPPKDIQLELCGDVKSTGVYGCIEGICKICDKIVVVWTPRCEEDKQMQEIINSLKAYKCYTSVSDIIVILYGFRKPVEQNIFLSDTYPVEYEDTYYFFSTMEKILLGKTTISPVLTPPHQQSRGAESRQKSGQPASASDGLRQTPLGSLVNNQTLTKHVASSDQTADSALPYDVISDSAGRSVSTLIGPQDHVAHVSSALAMGGSRETSQSGEELATIKAFKTTSSKKINSTLSDSSIMNRTERKDGSYSNESDQKESHEEGAPEVGTGDNQSLTETGISTGEQVEGQIHEARSSAFIQQASDAAGGTDETNLTTIPSQSEGFREDHGQIEETSQSEKLQLSQTNTEKLAAMEGQLVKYPANENPQPSQTKTGKMVATIEGQPVKEKPQPSQTKTDKPVTMEEQPVKIPANERNTKASTDSTTFTSGLQRSTLETQKVSGSESGNGICKEGLSPNSCETSANAKKHSQNARKHSQSLDINVENGKSQTKQSSEPQLPETRHSSLTHAVVSAPSGTSKKHQSSDQDTESSFRNSVKADRNTDRQGRGAEEVGAVAYETSLSEETGLKSPFSLQSFEQTINNDTESEIKQETLAKQKYHADFQDSFEMTPQPPPVSINDDIITLQGEMISPSSSTMETGGECSAEDTTDYDSLDKLPYIDSDYNNSLQCEVDMLDIISKPTVENYQRTGLHHFHEEVPPVRLHTDSMSTEHDQTTLSGIQSSTGFQVQTTSLSDDLFHEIHPDGQASKRETDLKDFKSLQRPSLPAEEDKISNNKLNYKQPIQESQLPGCAVESGGASHTTLVHTESEGHHNGSAVTQSTMTSQPPSPTGHDVPNTIVINIAQNNNLYLPGATKVDVLPEKPMTEPGSSQPELPLGSDLTPRDGATPDPFRGEVDLQPDMEEIPSSRRSKGRKFLKFFFCGAQKRKKRKK